MAKWNLHITLLDIFINVLIDAIKLSTLVELDTKKSTQAYASYHTSAKTHKNLLSYTTHKANDNKLFVDNFSSFGCSWHQPA